MAQENNSAVDTANGLINAGVNAYKWGKRGVQTARTAGVAISTVGSGAWIPFAIAGVVVLIIFLLVLVNGSGEGLGSASSDDSPGVLLPPGGGTVPGGTCPDTSTNQDPNCHYLNPAIGLFDTSISQTSVNAYIEKYSPIFISAGKGNKAEFTRRVNYIISQSKKAGLNPALFLGYWRTETAFGTASTRELGCAGTGFEAQVDCAVGLSSGGAVAAQCARSKDANSESCKFLKSIRSNPWNRDDPPNPNNGRSSDEISPISYPVSTFDDFAEAYGPISDQTDLSRAGNCSHTYNLLVEMGKELGMCKPSPSGPGGPIIPVGVGGTKIASAAKQIANQLIYSTTAEAKAMGCDPGGTYGPSFHCWSEMGTYDQALDPDYLQCTEFVWAAFDKAGYGTQINLIKNNNAYDWPEAADRNSSNFKVFDDATELQPGDIISMGIGGIVSHVSVVISKEFNAVRVAQASTQQQTEVWNIVGKKLNPPGATNARCSNFTNTSCRIKYIRLTKI